MKTFAERLKKAREAKGLSQADLADAVGVRAQQIWRYEAGRAIPDNYERVEKLAEVLELDPAYLAGREMKPNTTRLSDEEANLIKAIRDKDYMQAISIVSDLSKRSTE